MKDRIQRIIDDKNMTPSRFADEVGINRPTVSHILNGRNNPGLEVLQRILSHYKDINAGWLISGDGPMYNSNAGDSTIPFLFDETGENAGDYPINPEYPKDLGSKTAISGLKVIDNQSVAPKNIQQVKVKKIAIFYSDNTYEEFIPAREL